MTANARSIYMDYNASAPLLPDVREAMLDVMGRAGNSSSIHSHGRVMRSYVDTARRQILSGLLTIRARRVRLRSRRGRRPLLCRSQHGQI